jgi:membrane protein required for colicin V production
LIADIVVAVVLLISGVIGLFRGFVKETLTIAGWIGAILITLYGYPFVSPLLASFITDNFVANIITASVLFLVSLILLTILTHMIANRVQGSMLSHLDRALGFVFGLARGLLLVAIIYLGGAWFLGEDKLPDQITEAKSLPFVKMSADFLASLVPDGTFSGDDGEGFKIDDAVEKIKESVGDAVESVINDKADEIGDQIKNIETDDEVQRLSQPEPDTPPPGAESEGESEGETEAGPEAGAMPEVPAGDLPPPPGYEINERSDMQRLIENNQ